MRKKVEARSMARAGQGSSSNHAVAIRLPRSGTSRRRTASVAVKNRSNERLQMASFPRPHGRLTKHQAICVDTISKSPNCGSPASFAELRPCVVCCAPRTHPRPQPATRFMIHLLDLPRQKSHGRHKLHGLGFMASLNDEGNPSLVQSSRPSGLHAHHGNQH
ncbi:hypothetical protein NEUTE2DRAFT_125596 [Neurospora tetrasperma FGSC 2509]|nr:hypothetical protein NEUTE2DRAFT_125596 [Neurospora tetrasperma FGSC 2509]